MVTSSSTLQRSATVRSRGMTWDRIGAISGIVFAILFVAVVFTLAPGLPGGGSTNEDIARYYTEQDRFVQGLASMYGLALVGISFLMFVASVYLRLRQVEGRSTGTSLIVFGSGVTFVGALFGVAATAGAMVSSAEFGKEQEMQTVVASLGWLAGMLLIVPGMIAAAIAIIATSVQGLRTGVFPRWLAGLGFVCAAILISLGWAFMPIFVLPIWVAATSIVLFRDEHGVAVPRG